MDSKVKESFDALCAMFGMSANTAMNVFANAVVRYRKIPFEIGIDPVYDKGMAAFNAIRAKAMAGELPDLTEEEIEEEIRQYRKGK